MCSFPLLQRRHDTCNTQSEITFEIADHWTYTLIDCKIGKTRQTQVVDLASYIVCTMCGIWVEVYFRTETGLYSKVLSNKQRWRFGEFYSKELTIIVPVYIYCRFSKQNSFNACKYIFRNWFSIQLMLPILKWVFLKSDNLCQMYKHPSKVQVMTMKKNTLKIPSI